MNLGKVKTFLIVLFLGINIYLLFSMYFSSRFFVSEETIKGTVDILDDYGIEVNEDTVLKYTVNLRNIDTENVVYTEDFTDKKGKDFKVRGNEFYCRVKSEGIHTKSDRAIKQAVKKFLKDKGFSTKYMKFVKGKDKWHITCNVNGYEIFDSLISLKIGKDEFSLLGTWFEPVTSDIRSHSRVRSTVYITGVLMDMTQGEDIMKNAPFEITDIKFGYLAGKPYGEGSHVTATALPYYQIKDNKGNVYYYDAQSGTRLKF